MITFNDKEELRKYVLENILTTSEALKLTNMDRHFIWKKVKAKKLKAIKTIRCNTTLFFKDEFLEFENNRPKRKKRVCREIKKLGS